jgi:hypothetical protein
MREGESRMGNISIIPVETNFGYRKQQIIKYLNEEENVPLDRICQSDINEMSVCYFQFINVSLYITLELNFRYPMYNMMTKKSQIDSRDYQINFALECKEKVSHWSFDDNSELSSSGRRWWNYDKIMEAAQAVKNYANCVVLDRSKLNYDIVGEDIHGNVDLSNPINIDSSDSDFCAKAINSARFRASTYIDGWLEEEINHWLNGNGSYSYTINYETSDIKCLYLPISLIKYYDDEHFLAIGCWSGATAPPADFKECYDKSKILGDFMSDIEAIHYLQLADKEMSDPIRRYKNKVRKFLGLVKSG